MPRQLLLLMLACALGLGACRSSPHEHVRATIAPTEEVAAAMPVATPVPLAPAAAADEVVPVAAPEPEPEPPVAAPVRLRIPRISVDARIVPVGVNRFGEMDTPNDAWTVAWYAPGFKPGESGNSVLAGHVDYIRIGPAVFWNLRLLQPGDRLQVVAADEQQYEFEVKEVQRYLANDAPVERIFGENPHRGLNLITCGGTFNARSGEYDQRVVVYTEAVVQTPPASEGPPPRVPRILRPDAG